MVFPSMEHEQDNGCYHLKMIWEQVSIETVILPLIKTCFLQVQGTSQEKPTTWQHDAHKITLDENEEI